MSEQRGKMGGGGLGLAAFADAIAGTALIATVALLFSLAIYKIAVMPMWEAACIKHGAAHYDPKTSRFTWNDETPATMD